MCAADLTVQAQLPVVWGQMNEIAGISARWVEYGVPLADPDKLVETAVRLQALARELQFLAQLVGEGSREEA